MKSDKQILIKKQEAALFLAAAIDKVDSKWVREWATSEHNHGIWLKSAAIAVSNGKSYTNTDHVLVFSAYIVCVAIGA